MEIYEKYLTEGIDKKTLAKASKLGAGAFKKGMKSIPAQDKELMKLLKGLPVGGGGASIMDAWSKAWHKENLK
jgi:hypothetical protein